MSQTSLSRKRVVVADGFRVELDLSSQVLKIDTLPDSFGFYSETIPEEIPVRARIGDLAKSELVSASVLAQKAKIFDDGLYAAVEIAAQNGAGRFKGKSDLLRSVGRLLADSDPIASGDVQEIVLGAAQLGQVSIPNVPEEVDKLIQCTLEDFLADELRSKPIGFYTWSEELARIFRQDRMLQTELRDHKGIEILAEALRADPSARMIYESYLRLISRLTNPLVGNDLREVIQAMDHGIPISPECKAKFFPPSVAHETNIVKKLYGDSPIPEGFVLVDEMIRQIRSGELDLIPWPESGWYDHQTWALEPLVIPEQMPEASHLKLSDEYRKLLIELFKGILTLTRETHIKQLEMPAVGLGIETPEAFIDVLPELSAEPVPTYYLRRALSYRFVRNVLEECFGPGELERMHRLTPNGPVLESLAEELSAIEALFTGAHAVVAYQLGMDPDIKGGDSSAVQSAAERFTAWAADLRNDVDLGQDLRMMVPVFYDIQRGKTKIWVFLGWSQKLISVGFAQHPEARVLDSRGRAALNHPRIRWVGSGAQLAYPVTAEIYVDRILNRDEFRTLCDACGTRSEILEKLGVPPNAFAEAVKKYQEAADQGDVNAMRSLGNLYKESAQMFPRPSKNAARVIVQKSPPEVDRNLNTARYWYEKAADQGDVDCQRILGTMFEDKWDFREARRWYQRAADQGDIYSQRSLGLLYVNAKGVHQDCEEAKKWYRKAAEQGDAVSQRNLAWLLVADNPEEALAWFRKAADQGDAGAQGGLEYVMSGLPRGNKKMRPRGSH